MDVTRMIEDGAGRVDELLAKLGDAKGTARARDRLLGELEGQVEEVRRLDERHLFPVLRGNPDTRALVQPAEADLAAVRGLLRDVKSMPKEGDAFLGKIAELRRAFRRSLRDDGGKLLPVIRTALAAADAVTLADAERKKALDQARERLSAQNAAGEATAVAGGAADRAAETFGMATHLPRVAAEAMGETGRVLSDFTSRAVASGQRASRDISRCGTPLEAATIQARLMQEMAEAWMETGSRMVEISMRASQEAVAVPLGRDRS